MPKRFAAGLVSGAVLASALAVPSLAQDVAVRGGTVHTMAGPAIEDGVVVIRDGKIVAVGPAATTPVPQGLETLTAEVVTPGLVDARTVVGLAGYLNQEDDQDQLDEGAPIQPHLRAIDGYDPAETLVDWLRNFGVTTIHTGHGPGTLVSGQTMVAKTWARTADAAAIVPRAMVAANLGPGSLGDEGGAPGTRAKQIAMIRTALTQARTRAALDNTERDQAKGTDAEVPGLEEQVMREVIQGRLPLMVTANRAQDIMNALRLKEEFGIDLVLDGAAESYLLLDEIRTAEVSVILHPTMTRHGGDYQNASFTTAAKLAEAGIPFALQSGFEGYVPKTRVILFEAAVAAANGLPWNDALETITIDAARIIGVGDRLGSLEVGKDGDVAMFDGDPFEYTTHATGVVIGGQVASRAVQ
ncbi:amidohydrolase family protein [Qipengyuania sp. MTN3-11]|uniref:amidohydrolase family protein n=1 Tax=Qipengyuania sp. MTN3-11 TaxID=3056557 RepID=UPI0036F352C3